MLIANNNYTMSYLIKLLNISTDTLLSTLEPSAYIDITYAYLFELFSTYHWDNDDHNLIGAYLKHQGWKETPYDKHTPLPQQKHLLTE